MATISATTQHHSGPLNRGLTLAPSPRTNPVAGHSSYPAKRSLAWSRSSWSSLRSLDLCSTAAPLVPCLWSACTLSSGGTRAGRSSIRYSTWSRLARTASAVTGTCRGHIPSPQFGALPSEAIPDTNADMVTDVHMPSRCRKARHCTRHNPITETATGIHPSITSTHHGYPNNLCAKEREINS